MTDEMSDGNGRYVLTNLAAPLKETDGAIKSFLLDTIFLEATNHSTVSKAIVAAVHLYGIDFDNVAVINTDNAAYMKNAYTGALQTLFPNSKHITCMAHIMNLLGDSFKKPFREVNTFVKSWGALFFRAGARKFRYQKNLKAERPEETARMAPNPIATRWNCWYDSVKYHERHFDCYRSFANSEMELSKSQACDSLRALQDDKACILLLQQVNFITEKSCVFVDATDIFQSQSPTVLKVWSMLQDLQCRFQGGVSRMVVSKFFHEDMSPQERNKLEDVCNTAYALTSEKLDQYLTKEGQPGIDFLREVPFFNPAKLLLSPPWDQLESLTKLKTVPEEEIKRYTRQLGPLTVKNSITSSVDVPHFWQSISDEVPALAACAKWYIYTTINSADAERNLILSDRRRSLSTTSLRHLAFLCYNKKIKF